MVFLTAQWLLWHTDSLCLAKFFIAIYIGKSGLACCVYLCHRPRSHFTMSLTWALFIGPCHCSYIFVPCLAFCVHVAGDLNKTISFVVSVFLTSFTHTLLQLIHQSLSCPMQLNI